MCVCACVVGVDVNAVNETSDPNFYYTQEYANATLSKPCPYTISLYTISHTSYHLCHHPYTMPPTPPYRLRSFDAAVTRPGRFDLLLFVGTPNLDGMFMLVFVSLCLLCLCLSLCLFPSLHGTLHLSPLSLFLPPCYALITLTLPTPPILPPSLLPLPPHST